jgi:glyoxylase-like metal-dependent hydrolase (beta-lactamase superfamily II)
MQVFHTPGHSAGSLSLFLHNEGVLFSGDVIPVPGDLPVYDDALLSVRSVTKLKAIRGIRVLLSSWDEPRKEDNAYQQMDLALNYLQQVHEAVVASAGDGIPDLMELTVKTVALLGLHKVQHPLLPGMDRFSVFGYT